MPKMHLRHLELTCNACGSFTYSREQMQKSKEQEFQDIVIKKMN